MPIRPAPGLTKIQKQPENFASYLNDYANQSQYAMQYNPTIEQQSVSMSYFNPQVSQQIYVPVIVQNPILSPQYGYSQSLPNQFDNCVLTGRLKFFDEMQNYGFFTLDCDGSDLFVHYDDLIKSNITKEYIQLAKAYETRFMFRCLPYYGKYSLSYKAVDIRPLSGS